MNICNLKQDTISCKKQLLCIALTASQRLHACCQNVCSFNVTFVYLVCSATYLLNGQSWIFSNKVFRFLLEFVYTECLKNKTLIYLQRKTFVYCLCAQTVCYITAFWMSFIFRGSHQMWLTLKFRKYHQLEKHILTISRIQVYFGFRPTV